MECTDSNVSIDKTSKNKVSAVGANSLYIRKPCTIFFYEKVVKWCLFINRQKNTWQTTFYSLSGVLLIPHWIASVGQTFLHLPQRIHSGLLEFSTGSTIIWHAFAHFPHFIHLSLSTLYLYRDTGLNTE